MSYADRLIAAEAIRDVGKFPEDHPLYDELQFQQTVEFLPGWPLHERNGRHAMEILFVLRGPYGAITWTLNTGWWHPDDDRQYPVGIQGPEAFPLCYHSFIPLSDGDGCAAHECRLLDGQPCYSDITHITDDFLARLQRDGHAAVWEELRHRYDYVFGDLTAEQIREIEALL